MRARHPSSSLITGLLYLNPPLDGKLARNLTEPKNDRADAEAICEAVQRPSMRFVAAACCTEEEEAKEAPFPAVNQATRTEFGHPRSSIRLRTWAAMATSVARASSLWKRSPSPMTCFQRANWPSTPAR